MRSVPRPLVAALLYAFSNIAYAASESTSIEVQVTYNAYVKLVGTMVGAVKTFSVDAIRPAGAGNPNPTLSVGTLGLDSNIAGNCTVSFASLYGFSLKHTSGNQRLADYELGYLGNTIDSNNLTVVLPSCSSASSSLDFTAVGTIKKKARAGIYSDTVTIVVTTE